MSKEVLLIAWNLKLMTKALLSFMIPLILTSVKIVLNKPLLPNGTVIITTPFRVKFLMPSFQRLGHVGQSYMISQWYR